MNKRVLTALTFGVFGAALANQAMAQSGGLSNRAQQLLFYRALYQGPRDQREQLQVQRQFQSELSRYAEAQNSAPMAEDPVERLLREGRTSNVAKAGAGQEKKGAKSLPAIYSGNQVNRQYFMRINYFGSAAQSPIARQGSPSGARRSSQPRRYF